MACPGDVELPFDQRAWVTKENRFPIICQAHVLAAFAEKELDSSGGPGAVVVAAPTSVSCSQSLRMPAATGVCKLSTSDALRHKSLLAPELLIIARL